MAIVNDTEDEHIMSYQATPLWVVDLEKLQHVYMKDTALPHSKAVCALKAKGKEMW